MTKLLRWSLLCALFLALGAFLIWAFRAHRAESAAEAGRDAPIKNPTLVARTAAGDSVIKLTPETQERIGLRTVALAAVSLQPQMVAYGKLEEDPSRSFVLRAPLAGTLQNAGWPAVGQTIPDGTVVGAVEPRIPAADRVNLTDRLASARAEMDAISASRTAARAAHQRARTLNADNKNVSDRAVEEAEARMKAEEARYTGAERTVHLIESSLQAAAGPAGAVPLRIERGGQVVELLAQPGESIESGQPILRVSRFDRLLARVDLPAGDHAGAAAAGARIVAVGREDRPVRATRIALAPAIDPKTQGQSFLFQVADAGLALRPGQAVTAYLELPGAPRRGVVVPRAAVLRYTGKTWVYAQAGAGQFTRREVLLDDATAGGWFTQSLAPGDRVVTDAAQTLLSEELKSQIQVGEENPQ
jgi:HlyD family secretion protein